MSTEQFIQERKYLKAVSENTLDWYRDSFKAFEGALDSTETINQRIMELGKRGVKPVYGVGRNIQVLRLGLTKGLTVRFDAPT